MTCTCTHIRPSAEAPRYPGHQSPRRAGWYAGGGAQPQQTPVSLGRVAEVSRDGEAILSTSKSRCLALHSNVSQPAKANATHPAEGTIQAEGSQEDEAEAEAETDANVEHEGDM